MLKENELGISKIKELNKKLETAEKQIKDLSQKLEEKNKIIENLKDEIKKYKLSSKKFNNLAIETNLNKIDIIGLLLYNKNLDETMNTINNTNLNLNLEEENKLLKGKITKMKNAIIELSSKLDKELLIKEQKNLKINESNSKLFEELQKKTKDLSRKLKEENMNIMALRKEKYDLETSGIIKSNIYNKKNILPQNIHIIGKVTNTDSNPINNSQLQKYNIHNRSGILPAIK